MSNNIEAAKDAAARWMTRAKEQESRADRWQDSWRLLDREARDTRTMAHLWKEVARLAIRRENEAIEYAATQACLDKDAHWRLDEALERAEKAEQNADTHRHTATGWMNTAQDWQAVAEEWEARSIRLARALDLPDTATTDQMVARIEEINAGTHAPDPEKVADQLLVSFSPTEVLIEHPLIGRHARDLDIPVTDEMVERALAVERRVYDGYTTEPVTMRELLTAALTVPTRPEGAEGVEALIEESLSGDALSDAQVRALADFLAERGVRAPEDGEGR